VVHGKPASAMSSHQHPLVVLGSREISQAHRIAIMSHCLLHLEDYAAYFLVASVFSMLAGDICARSQQWQYLPLMEQVTFGVSKI
jgi:hypothetical protein